MKGSRRHPSQCGQGPGAAEVWQRPDQKSALRGADRPSAGRRLDVDMTQGPILRHLLAFALPLLAGNLFQQLYNMADAWVVGNFVSNEAFSAIGSVTPVTRTLIGFFMGLSNGAGVVIARYYGAKRFDQVRGAVQTSILMTLLLGVFFTLAGVAMTPALLHLMHTPPEVWADSRAYLTIYFAGILGLMLYNIGAGVLQAAGNSRLPFIYLAVCALTNTGLDLVLVLRFRMGIRGVAYATIFSQFFSAALVVRTLCKTDSCVRILPRALRLDAKILREILRVGLPAALQLSITAFSNVFVQSYINRFGADCMSGWTAYQKTDQLLILPITSMGLATTTFVGQNLGTGQVERARRGVRASFAIAESCILLLVTAVCFAAAPVVAFFNAKPEVVAYGSLFLRRLTPFYLIAAANHILPGALRGAGDSRGPMCIILGAYVAARQAYLYVTARFISNTALPIAMAYPFGWVVCAAALAVYYQRRGLGKVLKPRLTPTCSAQAGDAVRRT